MRARYWLLAAACAFALGVFFRFFVFGYGFAGLLLFCAGAVCAAFGVLALLKKRFPKSVKWLTRILAGLLALLALLAGTTYLYSYFVQDRRFKEYTSGEKKKGDLV